eukprot:5499211-Pleurochrysis_carterae.AAC.1
MAGAKVVVVTVTALRGVGGDGGCNSGGDGSGGCVDWTAGSDADGDYGCVYVVYFGFSKKLSAKQQTSGVNEPPLQGRARSESIFKTHSVRPRTPELACSYFLILYGTLQELRLTTVQAGGDILINTITNVARAGTYLINKCSSLASARPTSPSPAPSACDRGRD